MGRRERGRLVVGRGRTIVDVVVDVVAVSQAPSVGSAGRGEGDDDDDDGNDDDDDETDDDETHSPDNDHDDESSRLSEERSEIRDGNDPNHRSNGRRPWGIRIGIRNRSSDDGDGDGRNDNDDDCGSDDGGRTSSGERLRRTDYSRRETTKRCRRHCHCRSGRGKGDSKRDDGRRKRQSRDDRRICAASASRSADPSRRSRRRRRRRPPRRGILAHHRMRRVERLSIVRFGRGRSSRFGGGKGGGRAVDGDVPEPTARRRSSEQ
mmetsp:Transcript_24443/g.50311  ORF Transcript_24443/g.50311 Transcript_24443/m.50311 type:complete len:264 (+) Transcript_24443:1705-2496(+)